MYGTRLRCFKATLLTSLSTPNSYTQQLYRADSTQAGAKKKTEIPKALNFHPDTPPALKQFFPSDLSVFRDGLEYGRGWSKDELRLKSSEDLHKLWYILLKESNMLLTLEYEAYQTNKMIKRGNRKAYIILAMRDIKIIIAEREKSILGALHLQEQGYGEATGIESVSDDKPTLMNRILKFFKMK